MRKALLAQRRIEEFARRNGGSYDRIGMQRINGRYDDSVSISGTKDTYRVGYTSVSSTFFVIRHRADGGEAFICTFPGEGACPADGTWSRRSADR